MPRQPNAEGFAQIIVLSGLAVLGGIIAAVQLQTAGAIRTQSALQQTITGRIAAESAARRVFAAIEDENDPLELTLLGEAGTLQLREAGIDVVLSLEHEGSKISTLNPGAALFQRYLVNLGVDASLPTSLAPSELRALVTTRLLEQGIKAAFDEDFSQYHMWPDVDTEFAPPRVLDALDHSIASGTVFQKTAATPFTIHALVDSTSFRLTFQVTLSSAMQVLGFSR